MSYQLEIIVDYFASGVCLEGLELLVSVVSDQNIFKKLTVHLVMKG